MEGVCPKPHYSPGCEYSQSTEVVYKIDSGFKYKTKNKVPKVVDPASVLFDANGKLTFPPIVCIKEHEELTKRLQEERAQKLEGFPSNVITLKELKTKYESKKPKVVSKNQANSQTREDGHFQDKKKEEVSFSKLF